MNVKVVKIDSEVYASEASDRWKCQYNRDGHWRKIAAGNSRSKYEELVQLGPTPTSKQVDEVIGNSSWTTFICDGCGNMDTREGIMISVHADDEKCFELCLSCSKQLKGLLP